MLCHSVRSVRSPDPLSVQLSSVAMENRQKGVPLAVYFISGSRPSRPTSMTLLTDFPMLCLQDLVPPCGPLQILQVDRRIHGFLRVRTFFRDALQNGCSLR